MDDPVNHPKHYTSGPICPHCGEVVECITITREKNFNIGNVIKYLWRLGKKDEAIQELKKAAWYLNDEIKRLESEK